jgi:hypothetical protein
MSILVYAFLVFIYFETKKNSTGRGGGRGAKPPYARFTALA